MPETVTSTCSEPEEFETALRAEGCLSLLITARGRFRARLTRISLHEMHLSATEEQLSRITFAAVPKNVVLIVLPFGDALAPVCAGMGLQASKLITVCCGAHFHTRTAGASHWGAIWLPFDALVDSATALSETPISVPVSVGCWRPRRAAEIHLKSLYTFIYDFGGSSDGFPSIAGAPSSGIENAFVTYNVVSFASPVTSTPRLNALPNAKIGRRPTERFMLIGLPGPSSMNSTFGSLIKVGLPSDCSRQPPARKPPCGASRAVAEKAIRR